MRIAIIGATGHIGTYLVPRLAEDGHEVLAISRGQRQPYQSHGAWSGAATGDRKAVTLVRLDRTALEASGQFGEAIRALRADAVVDLTCFTLDSARELAEALRGSVQHFLHCGTIWVHGPSVCVPTTEEQPRRPFGEYGVRKAQIEAWLLGEARLGRLPATVLHPGHIVGPGWEPLNPAGHFNPQVFGTIARGEELALPHIGMETVHHVHADDVAQAFQQAIRHWSASVGESFHVVSPAAVTLRGFAESVAGWFGREAALRFLPWETWRSTVSQEEADATWSHIAHSPNCSIAKAERLIRYRPRYTSLQGVREAVNWLVGHGVIEI